jgi:hypothetical protein
LKKSLHDFLIVVAGRCCPGGTTIIQSFARNRK